MTKHQLRLLYLYTDYLLLPFGATTATGLSRLVPEVSQDRITRLLSQPAAAQAGRGEPQPRSGNWPAHRRRWACRSG